MEGRVSGAVISSLNRSSSSEELHLLIKCRFCKLYKSKTQPVRCLSATAFT